MNISMYRNWDIPDFDIDNYAKMISLSKTEMNDIPGPPEQFFVTRLKALKERTDLPLSFHALPMHQNQPIGWGHLSVFGDNNEFAELFVHIKKEFRNKGYGTRVINALLRKAPESITKIEMPALIRQREYLKKHLCTKVESSELRGLVLLNDVSVNEEYSNVYTHEDLYNNKELTEKIINHLDLDKSYNEYINEIQLQNNILGKKYLYSLSFDSLNNIDGCIVVNHNFEQNNVLGFVTAQSNSFNSDSQIIKLLESVMSYMKSNTDVNYFLTFQFDKHQNAYEKVGMKYINTLDHHILKIKGVK